MDCIVSGTINFDNYSVLSLPKQLFLSTKDVFYFSTYEKIPKSWFKLEKPKVSNQTYA